MKSLPKVLSIAVLTGLVVFLLSIPFRGESENEEENEGNEIRDRYAQLDEQMRDPSTGQIPNERLLLANQRTEESKRSLLARTTSMAWTERGPIYDSLGPSNGNTRGGSTLSYTSGMLTAFLVDTLNDASGNTVFAGSPGGGLWKCTNFLSTSSPNWYPINEYMANIAIAAICQNPSSPNIMYLATGDGNQRDIRGFGVWKSTDAGTTWSLLPTTTNFTTAYKIICDASDNVYLATGGSYLQRSMDGGATWTNISPATAGVAASNQHYVPDMELSATGRLHIALGYLGSRVEHWFTDTRNDPTPAWTRGQGLRVSNTSANRMEIAVKDNLLYAVVSNASSNVDSCYRSIDGGANWTKQNTTVYATGVSNGQGYYNITLQIDPDNWNNFLTGGLDAYRSTDAGVTVARQTYWVTSAPYLHADHHNMLWWKVGSESRVIVASDGGLFLSRDGGVTWRDRNQNLAIKQFYSCAIHPTASTDYFLAGAQDNGSHQLKNAGKSYSFEVMGGDGCYVHINQQDPTVQFVSYVYNQYRRSTDGGNSWSSVNPSNSLGYFVNPFDYDDANNIMYASYSNRSTTTGNNTILRWANANTGTATTTFVDPNLSRSGVATNASALKVSPFTANRLYVGTNKGQLVRIDNANTAATGSVTSTVISDPAFPSAYMQSIVFGSTENVIAVTFSNYGVNNIWYTTDGGTSWSQIDGNLPDMPVWWSAFEPGNDSKMVLATEAGVYTTQLVNGGSTQWVANPAFPTVRTTMLKVRASDGTILASTYGRGLWTSKFPNTLTPEINFTTPSTTSKEDIVTTGCDGYRDYYVNVSVVNPPTGNATVTYSVSGTATRALDYQITTNGDFNSPSVTHTFTSGQTGAKTIAIRVYDDAEVEGNETFTINYTISGTTNAVAGNSSNTHTFTIQDNDAAPSGSSAVSGPVGGSYTTNLSQPFRSEHADARTQILYTAAELQAAGFVGGGTINSLGFYVVQKNSTLPYTNFNIKLKNTTTSALSGGGAAFESGATTVYSNASYSLTGTGLNSLSITPFVWDGTSNLLVEVCWDNTAANTASGVNDLVQGAAVTSLCHFDRISTNAVPGCSMTNANYVFTGGARPLIYLSGTSSGTNAATTLNTTKSNSLKAGADQYYYSATGEIIARVKNNSAHDFGCTQVLIDRDGSGGGNAYARPFWNNAASTLVTAKTWRVIPTTNNTSGSAPYQITLYFSAAEKAGWEAATGNSWNNIKIVKVKSQISNYTPANPNADGAANQPEIVTPTFGMIGSNIYTLTYTFSSGFSGFAAGIPSGNPLPVGLTTFTGRLDGNTGLLEWSTSMEQNSKNFEVEKSTDGVNYYTIGTVAAAGNSQVQRTYNFRDSRLAEQNYYRLRINDLDGRFKRSQVVLLRHNARQDVWVVNNPFNSYLDIRFAKKALRAELQLVAASGAVVARKQMNTVSGQQRWDLPVNLTKGSYVLHVVVNGERFSQKLIKQ